MAGQEQDLRRFVGGHHHQVGSHHLLHLGSRDIQRAIVIIRGFVVGEHVVHADLLMPVAAEEQHVVGGDLVLAVPGHQGGIAVEVDIGDVDFPARVGLVQAEQLVQLLEDRARTIGRRVGERAFLREDDDLHVLIDTADDLPAFIAQGEELIRRQVKVDREPFVEDIRHHVDQDDDHDDHRGQRRRHPAVTELAGIPLPLFLFRLYRLFLFFPGVFTGGLVNVPIRPCGGVFVRFRRLRRGFPAGKLPGGRRNRCGRPHAVFRRFPGQFLYFCFRKGAALQLLALRCILLFQAHAPFRIGGTIRASPARTSSRSLAAERRVQLHLLRSSTRTVRNTNSACILRKKTT